MGRLGDAVYLLVWRDTTSGAHMIQEAPPFQGTHEERQEFLARWEGPVNDKIAFKHPYVSHRGFRVLSKTRNKYVSLFAGLPAPSCLRKREKDTPRIPWNFRARCFRKRT